MAITLRGNADSDFSNGIDIDGTEIELNDDGTASFGDGDVNIDGDGRVLIGTSSYDNTRQDCAIYLDNIATTPGFGNITLGFNGTAFGNQNVLNFFRTRGTSPGDVDIVQNGDFLGSVQFTAADGVDVRSEAASIRAQIDAEPGENDTPGCLVFSTTNNGSNSSTERMRINSGGQLLVGTTAGWFDRLMVVEATNNGPAFIGNTVDGWPISILNTATSGDNQFVGFWTEARGTPTFRGNIDYNRAAGQVRFNATSDRRLKSNIQDSDTALSVLDQIKVRSYTWAETGHGVAHGFIAQELNDAVPDAVKVGDESDEVIDTWAVDNSKLVPLLTKALQEALKRIENLESRLSTLEGGNNP